MKKIGTIFLTFYFTVATLAAVIFGYLYFTTRNIDNGVSLDMASSKVLINTVCYDLGLISKDDYESVTKNDSKSQISSNSITYEDYKNTTVDFEPTDWIGTMSHTYDMSILLAKYAFEEDIEEGKYYYGQYQGYSIAVKCDLDENKLIFRTLPCKVENGTPKIVEGGETVFVFTANGTKENPTANWSLDIKAKVLTGDGTTNVIVAGVVRFEGTSFNPQTEARKISRFAIGNIALANVENGDVTSVSSVDEISSVSIYDCDIISEKKLIDETGTNLTDQEKIDCTNKVLNSVKDVVYDSAGTYANVDLNQCDFVERYYQSIQA